MLILFAIVVIDLIGFGIVIPLLPFYGKQFGASASAITMLMATYSACQLIMAPVLGRLSDRLGRRPVLLLSLAGSVASYLWLGFADALMRSLNALLDNATYLKKLPIPAHIFVAKAALSALLSMMLSLLLLPLLFAVVGQPLGAADFVVVPAAVLLIGFAFGLGLLLGTLNVFFRDVAHLTAVVLQLWMWCTPIVYTIEIVPERYRYLFWLNPVHPYILAIREAFLERDVAAPATWLAMAGWDAVALFLGLVVMARLRHEVRDVL